MTDKWLLDFQEQNNYSDTGILWQEAEPTDESLLECLFDWLRDQLGPRWAKLEDSLVSFSPDDREGILMQIDLEGTEFFPFLTLEMCKRGFIVVTRVGAHMDNVIRMSLADREPYPTFILLVEEFL